MENSLTVSLPLYTELNNTSTARPEQEQREQNFVLLLLKNPGLEPSSAGVEFFHKRRVNGIKLDKPEQHIYSQTFLI